ncbi:hypothetical protein N8071_00215 [bacterium]|nr:hypothetical protein [bacterium]
MEPQAIDVCLFGPFALRRDGQPVPLNISGKTLDVLRYLIIHAHRPLRRDHLADIFWCDSSDDRRRSALNSAIWRIRGVLKPLGGFAIWSRGGAVGLDLAPQVSVDVIELSHAFDAALAADRCVGTESLPERRLANALDLCEAPFLDGAPEEWAIVEREKFFELRMRGLGLLMRRAGQARRYEDAVEYGARLLAEDPFREGVHCELMWLYVLSGRRARALAQYETCARLLAEELDIEPMAELRALYDHIRADCAAPAPRRAAILSGGAAAPEDLDRVLGAIERSRVELYEALCDKLP